MLRAAEIFYARLEEEAFFLERAVSSPGLQSGAAPPELVGQEH
jgi:hypothetical protein